MDIGDTIKKYRKNKNMTQEKMAYCLGVTASAVNKWENNNSLPDTPMLVPIARLLDITTDELLSYRQEISKEEINAFIKAADEKLKREPFHKVFEFVKNKAEKFPNSEEFLLRAALFLDARIVTDNIAGTEIYDRFILESYEKALGSKEESTRITAADCLYSYYFRNEQYEKAEEYLRFFSSQNPERKRKQAVIYSKTNRLNEAYREYEEILFSCYLLLSGVLNGIYSLALNENDIEKARYITQKQLDLAKIFEFGKHYETSCKLDLALKENNAGEVIKITKELLDNMDSVFGYCESKLYEHMDFKKPDGKLIHSIKAKLIGAFEDTKEYGFLKNNKQWENMLGSYKAGIKKGENSV